MPRGSSQTDLSDYMAEIDAAIEDLKEERLEKIKIYREIEMRIRCMKDEDEQEVLRLKYIKGMNLETVAEKNGLQLQNHTGYSRKSIEKL